MRQFYDPVTNLVYREFRRSDVEAVDYIIKLARGKRDVVGGESDWKVVIAIFEFLCKRYPKEMQQFIDTVPDIRATRRNRRALSPSKEIKYLAALPMRFVKMIRAIFPLQDFNKDFMYGLIRRMPIFRVGAAKE